MTTKLPQPIEEAQAIMYNVMRSYKLNEVSSRICSILYFSPEPISIEELAEETKYSLATISNTVRFLENFALVERVKKPGTKKIFVIGKRKPVDMMETKTKLALETEIKPVKTVFPKLIKEMKIFAKKDKKSKEQLELLKSQYEETLKMEKLFEGFLQLIEEVK